MGSFVEINDTLQLTREQGFPEELDYARHKEKLLTAESFAGRIFAFKDKPEIRIYKSPPVRNFLVENIDGKWLYWGHVHILYVSHDMVSRTTSGEFKITHIYSPDEMKYAHQILDQRPEVDYLNSLQLVHYD